MSVLQLNIRFRFVQLGSFGVLKPSCLAMFQLYKLADEGFINRYCLVYSYKYRYFNYKHEAKEKYFKIMHINPKFRKIYLSPQVELPIYLKCCEGTQNLISYLRINLYFSAGFLSINAYISIIYGKFLGLYPLPATPCKILKIN